MATRPEAPRIKPLYVALAVVVVIAAVGLFLVNRGGQEDLPPIPTARPGAGAGVTPVATPAPTPETTEVFEIFEGRDPFRPLLAAGDAGGPTPPPGSPAPPSPPGGPAEPTARPPRDGVQVEVLSVADDSSSATVRVGSRVHENARAGQTLSSGVVVVSIEGRCVRFRRDGDAFRLCEGEQVLK